MIKNERQYQITQQQVGKFQAAIDEFESDHLSAADWLRAAELDALRSQLTDLQEEVREYEELRAGQRAVLQVESLDALPLALIQARIASGLTQEQLAARLGMLKQQIQRYEATNYDGASWATFRSVAHALGVAVREDVVLPLAQNEPSSIMQRLQQAGLPHDFLRRRIASPALRARLDARNGDEGSTATSLQLGSLVQRIFGIDLATLFTGSVPEVQRTALAAAQFKLGRPVASPQIAVYATYAHYLAAALIESLPAQESVPIPTEPLALRAQVIARYGEFSFSSVLEYIWDHGIPVLPLNDPGMFHGATWRIDGRDVIVLKQRTQSPDRWLIDLLHELRHTQEDRTNDTQMLLEPEELGNLNPNTPKERAATQFALRAALDGRAEELTKECVNRAGGSVERLSTIVPRVAEEADVNTGILANYIAYRMSMQGIDWWGAATNLQATGQNPFDFARSVLFRRIEFSRLDSTDRQLLLLALTSP